MRLLTLSGVEVQVAESTILSAAGKINASRRKTFKGAPAKLHKCWRCGTEVLGMRLFEAHLQMCPAPPPAPVDDAYMRSIAWTPDAA